MDSRELRSTPSTGSTGGISPVDGEKQAVTLTSRLGALQNGTDLAPNKQVLIGRGDQDDSASSRVIIGREPGIRKRSTLVVSKGGVNGQDGQESPGSGSHDADAPRLPAGDAAGTSEPFSEGQERADSRIGQESGQLPAVAVIKRYPKLLQQLILEREDIFGPHEKESQVIAPFTQFFADKGFAPSALEYLANRGVLDNLFSNLVLRKNLPGYPIGFYSGLKPHLTTSRMQEQSSGNGYRGTSEQNTVIDNSIAESELKLDLRRHESGRGATRRFGLGNINRPAAEAIVGETPVIVVGGGPAGLMATREMIALGFSPRNITVINKSEQYGGIWNQKNVVNGTKNNPFAFDFDRVGLESAPGPGTTVSAFLQELARDRYGRKVSKPIQGVVTSVEPGDLHHRVTYRTDDGEHTIDAPIVINAIGTGKPVHPNRVGTMTTDTPGEAGIRWQQIMTEKQAERYRGKRLIFVGLGNSTIEMLQQVQEFNKKGFNIDYRVITHYPAQAVKYPSTQITEDGKTYQVFRDITAPNLTKVEGDLPYANDAYLEALHSGKIISDVTHWHSEDGKFTATLKDGSQQAFDFAQQYTLIGYVQDADMLRRMGMQVSNEFLGEVRYDYDGELQKQPGVTGRDRVYPGYFGLGAVLKTRDNPNAVVMPGIMHRMYDMLFSATIRAVEYKIKREQEERLARLLSS